MNFQDLRNLFEAYTGTQGEVEEAQLALWFNEAQLDLSYDLGTVVKWTPTGDAPYDLPADCLRIMDSDEDYIVTPDNKIYVTGGTDVYYFKMPTDFTGTDQTQESELHEALHSLLAMFAASRYFDQESEGDTEESTHATKWMNYYLQAKNNAKAKLQAAHVKIDRWRVI